MKRLFIISCLGVLLQLSSCTQQTSKEGDGGPTKITVGSENYQERIFYSQLFDSAKYVRLETGSDCLINKISKIIFFDNLFYILDNRQNVLFVFSDAGKFLWKIDKRGNGPGEYRQINDFDLSNNRLYLFDPYRNVLEYDLSGNFIKNHPIKMFGTSLLVNNESFYVNTCNNPSEQGNYHLLLMDNYGQTFKNGIPITQKNLIGDCITFQEGTSLFRYRDKIRFFMPFSTDVFSIEGDSISVQYRFDFKGKNLPEQYFNDYTRDDFEKSSLSYAHGLNSFWENDAYLLFKISFDDFPWTVLYSKTENKAMYGRFSDDIAFCWPVFQIVNDDFAIGFRPMNELYGEYRAKKEDRKNRLVGEIVENSEEDDNPVLFFYFFKKGNSAAE